MKKNQAVIYEGLRIHPPFTGLLCKQAPPGGDTYQGQFIPGGTRIAHNTWSVMRDRRMFGDDVEVFRPERWLGAAVDRAQRAAMERTVELAFGYGRWACAGKAVSFMELDKFYVEVSTLRSGPHVCGKGADAGGWVSKVLRHFDFQLVNPGRPWKSTNQGFFLQSDMWVKVTER